MHTKLITTCICELKSDKDCRRILINFTDATDDWSPKDYFSVISFHVKHRVAWTFLLVAIVSPFFLSTKSLFIFCTTSLLCMSMNFFCFVHPSAGEKKTRPNNKKHNFYSCFLPLATTFLFFSATELLLARSFSCLRFLWSSM